MMFLSGFLFFFQSIFPVSIELQFICFSRFLLEYIFKLMITHDVLWLIRIFVF